MAKTLTSKPPTLREIAALTGVSVSTAGHVLNGRGDELNIKQATQERIRQAAQELNYTPNYLARGLSGKRTKTVGILWSLYGPHDVGSIMQRMVQEALDRGYTTHLAESLSRMDLLKASLWEFSRRGVDGVIVRFTQSQVQHYAKLFENDESFLQMMKRFHAVCFVADVSADSGDPFPFDVVLQDNQQAYSQAAKHLLDQGRRRWAFVSDSGNNQHKYHATKQAAAVHGLDPGNVRLCTIDVDFRKPITHDEANKKMQRLTVSLQDVDAVFCHNDNAAIALIDWLGREGRRIPEDLAIIGYNDQFFAHYAKPALASITREDHQIIDAAHAMFYGRLERGNGEPQKQIVYPSFIPRASAGGC